MTTDVRVARLTQELGPGPARIARAPGRVNLIGDHTDYQDGFCLPLAIDLDVLAAFRATSNDTRVRVRSLDLGGTVTVDSGVVNGVVNGVGSAAPGWGRIVGAVVGELLARGRPAVGIDAVVDSTVPMGSGLSSSAAFEVALGIALLDAAGYPLPPSEFAEAMQTAEHVASDVPCGIMDQLASVAGVADHALLLDCRSRSVTLVPIPPSIDVVVVHSGLPRALANSEYAHRRASCESASARLGVATLREADAAAVADDPFARHVVSENARVLACADALRTGRVEEVGALMIASHRSLAHDFDVSTPELDTLVESLLAAGALGARLTGAGFGGCCTAIAPVGRGQVVLESAMTAYAARTKLTPKGWIVRATDGATVTTRVSSV